MAFPCCCVHFGVKTDRENITSGSRKVSQGPQSKTQSKLNFSRLKYRGQHLL